MGHKAKSITSKASSACKINMGLVSGEADVQNSKAFVDYGGIVEKKFSSGGGGTSSADETEVDTSKTSPDSDADIDMTKTPEV
jgi:hypothetical protein